MNHSTLFRASAALFPPPHSTFSSRSHSLSFSLIDHLFSVGQFVEHKACNQFCGFFCLFLFWFSYGYIAFCIYRTNVTDNIAIDGRNVNFSITTRQGKVVPILRDCSLRIPSGQFWMLLGPNGCGKSTLLKVRRYLPYENCFFSTGVVLLLVYFEFVRLLMFIKQCQELRRSWLVFWVPRMEPCTWSGQRVLFSKIQTTRCVLYPFLMLSCLCF